MKKEKNIIISLGGSLIIPKGEVAVDFLKKFRYFILKLLKQGYTFVIITGGGGINRLYNKEAQKITKIKDLDLDWLGISATRLNAELIRIIFSNYAYPQVIENPKTKIKTKKKIIIASGWRPGCSSDKDAVFWAENMKAKMVINLSDIDYVYDKDPDKYPEAKPLKEISWNNFLKIVGTKWSPRKSAPFGPPASKLAQKLKIKVTVLNGKNIKNLDNFLQGKKFKGTIIG